MKRYPKNHSWYDVSFPVLLAGAIMYKRYNSKRLANVLIISWSISRPFFRKQLRSFY